MDMFTSYGHIKKQLDQIFYFSQLQVSENYADLTKWRSNYFQNVLIDVELRL